MSALKRYAMTVDTAKCVGCNACVLACQAENDVPVGHCRSWVDQQTRGRFPNLSQEIRSERCNHCTFAPCVSGCPTGASWVNEGGAVLISREKCVGCKACIASCPYGARYVHPDGFIDKCSFCMHRVERGEQPACVAVCPTESLTFGDLLDPTSAVSDLLDTREWKVETRAAGTEPNLYFLD